MVEYMEKCEVKGFIPEFSVVLQTTFHSLVDSISEHGLQAEILEDTTAELGLSWNYGLFYHHRYSIQFS